MLELLILIYIIIKYYKSDARTHADFVCVRDVCRLYMYLQELLRFGATVIFLWQKSILIFPMQALRALCFLNHVFGQYTVLKIPGILL